MLTGFVAVGGVDLDVRVHERLHRIAAVRRLTPSVCDRERRRAADRERRRRMPGHLARRFDVNMIVH